MINGRCVASIVASGVLALGSASAFSQDYPVKPVRILTSPPGGGNDYVARIVAQALTGALGQAVVVDNRATLVCIEVAAKSPPDGYSLLVASSSLVTSHLLQDVSFDPVRDFSTITHIGNAPNVLVVHPSVPVKSVKDLIALAKARPGQLNYGSSGAGSSAHLSAELMKSVARVNMTRITYRGNGASLIGLLSGEIQVLFPTVPAAAPHVKSGKMRALAVTGLKPSVLTPGLPTMVDSGLPGYQIESIYGVVAPARTPQAIINRLDQELGKFLQTQGAREKLLTIGIETVSSTPQKYAAVIQEDIARMAKLIKDAGIRTEQY
jgi:tripartite-type tricarboxylate transporter receptor subunit TctC